MSLLSVGIAQARTQQSFEYKSPQTVAEVAALFPNSPDEITSRVEQTKLAAQQEIDALAAVPSHERTFDNTVGAFDHALRQFGITRDILTIVTESNPDDATRDTAREALAGLQAFEVDLFSNNRAVYRAFVEYQKQDKQEPLNQEQQHLLQELMSDFTRSGLALSDTDHAHAKQLQKEIAELKLQFAKNVADDKSTITVTRAELEGLDEAFIANLTKSEDGNYVLGIDYPTYHNVMDNCSVASTRKALYFAFSNCAYPQNVTVLQQLIAKQDELAKLLGYKSFAEYDLANQMVQTVDRARAFLEKIAVPANKKMGQECKLLSPGKKLDRWDASYLSTEYRKKHFNVDEQQIAEYFPTNKTIAGLISIYEQFMDLRIVATPAQGLWHEDLQLLAVYDNKQRLRGYVVLDLHPRPNKFSHAACFTAMPTIINEHGQPSVSVSAVLCNFPADTAEQPALLPHANVETFFHEFGHAIHNVLGSTKYNYFSGTATKTDFVELPSQILENWIWNPQVLAKVSSHYKTGQPLPAELIKKKIELKNFETGSIIIRQVFLALMSLEFFGPGATKDLDAIKNKLMESPYLTSAPDCHIYPRFMHLYAYGPKYYCYLWSRVFACDLFAEINKKGLLNPVVGTNYVQKILAPGGSKDPNEVLKDFLGRDPNQDAFYKDQGF